MKRKFLMSTVLLMLAGVLLTASGEGSKVKDLQVTVKLPVVTGETEEELYKNCAEKYERITKKLIEKKMTVTTMESCTSGTVASLLTDTEGSSAILKGARITYSNEEKIAARVPKEAIERYGVYSDKVAALMARKARENMKADIGIGVTGSFANVDPKNPDSVPGEVRFAINIGGNEHVYMLKGIPFDKRHYAKLYVAERIADELLKLL